MVEGKEPFVIFLLIINFNLKPNNLYTRRRVVSKSNPHEQRAIRADDEMAQSADYAFERLHS